MPLLIAIIAVLLAGAGYYLANQSVTPTPNPEIPINTVVKPSPGTTVVPEIGRIQVTSPKGGEVWQIGSSHVIAWTNYAGKEPLTIALQTTSPNGQGSAKIIAENVPAASTGSYTWTVTSENTDNKYKIEVYPAGGRELLGRSNDYFTLKVSPSTSKSSCVRGGCSGQLCAEEPVDGNGPITTCEYRAEYACYQGATCERQLNGSCGWTKTTELSACLSNPPSLQ